MGGLLKKIFAALTISTFLSVTANAFRDFACEANGVSVTLQANESRKNVHILYSTHSRWGVLTTESKIESMPWQDYVIFKMHQENSTTFDGSFIALNPNAEMSESAVTDFFEFNELDPTTYTHFTCQIIHP